jgi:hypothetical protein
LEIACLLPDQAGSTAIAANGLVRTILKLSVQKFKRFNNFYKLGADDFESD